MCFKDVDRAVGIFGEDGVKQSLVLALHFFVASSGRQQSAVIQLGGVGQLASHLG